jgi:hypothetical protein
VGTATQTLQTSENRFEILVRGPLLPTLAEWFRITRKTGDAHTSRSVAEFLSQIVEERLAEFRLLRIRPRIEPVCFREKGEKETASKRSRRKLAPDQVQVLLHLVQLEKLSIAVVAGRLRCSETTVRKYVDKYAERAHHPFAVQPGPNRLHGNLEEW